LRHIAFSDSVLDTLTTRFLRKIGNDNKYSGSAEDIYDKLQLDIQNFPSHGKIRDKILYSSLFFANRCRNLRCFFLLELCALANANTGFNL